MIGKAAMLRKIVILSATLFSLASTAWSQHNLTMYNMFTLPQRLEVNPAALPDSRFFISMPGLASVHFLYDNDGFKIKNLVSVDDSNRLVIHPKDFYNSLNKNNVIGLYTSYDVINFGFKLRKSFISFCLGEKFKSQMSFPRDFFGLLIIGNAGDNLGRQLNFNFGFDVMAYNDLSTTYSRSFLKDKLRLGVKASYLNGILNVNTERSNLYFTTNKDDFHYKSNNK